MPERELYCDICRRVRTFEVPPCVDGHDADCPELVCTGCASALLTAALIQRRVDQEVCVAARRPQ